MIIAHRGASSEAPENTKAAFKKALTYKINALECDVQLSKDNVPIIYHDRTLVKIGKNKKHISDFTYNELKKFDYGIWFSSTFKNEKLLTFEMFLKSFGKRIPLFIEIKSRPRDKRSGRSKCLTQFVIKIIQMKLQAKFYKNIFIISYDINVLKLANSTLKKINYFVTL